MRVMNWHLGPCLLIDSEQYNGKPYMFTYIKINTDGTHMKETIIIQEALNDRDILGYDTMSTTNRTYTWSPGKDKIWYALTQSYTPCRYMKYREFLNHIGSLCTNRGGSKDRVPNPMISWSRDADLEFMWNLDQYLPGEKFFKCKPWINPYACSDNVHWKKGIPQVCAQRLIVEMCHKFYSDTRLLKTKESPSSLQQVMRRFKPEYFQLHYSDTDVDDMFEVLVYAYSVENFQIPKTTFMYAKLDSIFNNLV